MDFMKNIKEKKDKAGVIIEGIVISFVGALALVSIVDGSFMNLNSLDFVKNYSLIKVILLLVITTTAMGVLYYLMSKLAKIIMFVSVFAYFLLTAYATANLDFTTITNNPIGHICFLAFSGFLTVIAFMYVKDEIFEAQEAITVSDKNLKLYTLLIGLCLLIITSVIGIFRYASYSSPSFDFGVFAQAFEYMKQTGELKTVVERGYLLPHYAVHVSPIFYIALPLYFIVPRAETVAVVQAIMVALPVLPIYLLGKQYNLSNKTIIGIMAIYALFPATIGGTLYDIHENCFLTFMILMLIWAVERKKNILMIVFALLTLFVKEDAAMYVMILGAFWIISRKNRMRGLILILLAGVYFVIAVNIIQSFGFEIQNYRLSNMFYDQKGNFVQILRVIITNPGYIITQFFANEKAENMDKIAYLIEIFAPIGVLIFATGKKYSRYILLGTIVLLGIAPIYVYQHDIGFQYNFGHIALITYLIIMNVADMKPKKKKILLVSSSIICAVMFAGLIFPKAPGYVRNYMDNKTTIEKFNTATSMVPKDKSVFTTGWVMPHLSRNLQCYDAAYLDSNHKKGVPEYPDYLLVDERETNVGNNFAPFINSGKYELIYNGDEGDSAGSIVSLYKLKSK